MQSSGWLYKKSLGLHLKSRDESRDKVFYSSELRSIHRSELNKLNNNLNQAVDFTHIQLNSNQKNLKDIFIHGSYFQIKYEIQN